MVKSDLLARIAQGEGAKTEFKRDDVRPEQLAVVMASFANMNGGVILLGVADDGSIAGLARKNPQEWLMDTVVGRHIHPAILPDYEELAIDGKAVAVVEVHEGMGKPYVVRHKDREDIYLRMGNTSRLATREQTVRLYDRGGLLATDKLPVHGSSFSDLDGHRCADYFAKVNKLAGSGMEQGEAPDEAAMVDWLLNRDLMRESAQGKVCTIAGLALFGLHPARRLPQASIRLAVYPGADKEIDSLLDTDLSAPFVGSVKLEGDPCADSVPDRVLELLRPHLCRNELNGMHRVAKWELPPEAIRELVVNAIAHRDWTRNTDLEISVYRDRMEVVSPGALPNGMTIEKLKAGQRVPRNNNIINVLRDYGLMEHQGMGIRRTVIPSMLAHNGTEPEFEATEDLFKVTLWRKP